MFEWQIVTAFTGDSLPLGKNVRAGIKHLVKGLCSWMRKELGQPIKDGGDNLPHGRQQDGYSCGICVVNTFAHALFNDKLFTHESRFLLRVEYFLVLARAQTALVS